VTLNGVFRQSDIITDAGIDPCLMPPEEGAFMNYKIAIIILGVALFVAAMIPYAYKPRCSTPDCPPEAPYFGERGNR
jgi:hypothetical protein